MDMEACICVLCLCCIGQKGGGVFFVHFVNVVHVSPPHPTPQQKPSLQYGEHSINTFFAPIQYIVLPQTIHCLALDNILYSDLRSKVLTLTYGLPPPYKAQNTSILCSCCVRRFGFSQIHLENLSLNRTFVLVSRRLRPLWTRVGGGQDIYKGVYYALVLTS